MCIPASSNSIAEEYKYHVKVSQN